MYLIVLFNLKPDQDESVYESWALKEDIPTVKGLQSVSDFKLFKAGSLFGSDARPPYRYVEMIHIRDPNTFGGEATSPKVQKVATAFQAFAESPIFMICDSID